MLMRRGVDNEGKQIWFDASVVEQSIALRRSTVIFAFSANRNAFDGGMGREPGFYSTATVAIIDASGASNA